VLKYPELPLNNNPAELLARKRVRKRDSCFGPRTPEGCKAWDTFMSLADTARKLDVNFYDYLRDRITGTHAIPPLVDLITQKAKDIAHKLSNLELCQDVFSCFFLLKTADFAEFTSFCLAETVKNR